AGWSSRFKRNWGCPLSLWGLESRPMTCSLLMRNNLRRHCLNERAYMREAMRLARRGLGATSPNPIVGAVLVKGGQVIGRGWHRRAGEPHAEIEAIRAAQRRGQNIKR